MKEGRSRRSEVRDQKLAIRSREATRTTKDTKSTKEGYDADGNLTRASNSVGTYTMGYDALDRMTSEQEPYGLTLTFSYDAVGNQTLVQDSFGGVTTSIYDADNRLVSEEFGGSGQTPLLVDLGYTARGQIAWENRYSDLAGTQNIGTTSYGYDADMRMTSEEQLNASGTVLVSYVYSYDAAGRLSTAETYNGATTSYSYDAMGELDAAGSTNYSYDQNGNRTGGGNTTGTDNQLTTDGTWNFTYDNEGNLTQAVRISDGLTWTYSYDNENHLTGAQETSGSTLLQQATYVFDALDNRSEKDTWTQSSGTTTTRFAYNESQDGGAGLQPAQGGALWADLNGSNALQTRYLRGDALDQLFARITGGTGGTASWYLTDREGSVQNLTDDSGNLQDTITYDAFGNVLSESNPSYGDRFKYTGSQLDSETGLQQDRARVYDSVHGRWMSQDPLGFSAGDTNLYRYVGNDPTGSTDPTGLDRQPDPSGSVQSGSDPWLPPDTPPSLGDITPGTPGAIEPLPGVGGASPEAGGLGGDRQVVARVLWRDSAAEFQLEDPGFQIQPDPGWDFARDPFFEIPPDPRYDPGSESWVIFPGWGFGDEAGPVSGGWNARPPELEPPAAGDPAQVVINPEDPGFQILPDPTQNIPKDPGFEIDPNSQAAKNGRPALPTWRSELMDRLANPEDAALGEVQLKDPGFEALPDQSEFQPEDPWFQIAPDSGNAPRRTIWDTLPKDMGPVLGSADAPIGSRIPASTQCRTRTR